MSFINRTPVEHARDDLDAALRRQRRWNRSVLIASLCISVDVCSLTADLVVGVTFTWSYALLSVCFAATFSLGVYAWYWRRRAVQAVSRARLALAHAERHADGPEDARPEGY